MIRLDLIRRYREGLRAMIDADQRNERDVYKRAVAETLPINKLMTREELDFHLRGDKT